MAKAQPYPFEQTTHESAFQTALRRVREKDILRPSMKSLTLLGALALSIHAASLPPQWQIEDKELLEYFRRETRALSDKCVSNLSSKEDWNRHVPEMRQQLAEMLGLSPMPARTDLKATVTKRLEHDPFTVENLHFQSRPGLYVTANLYVPKNLTKPAPTILYVCGHGPMITNGISYGTKATYQHHGAWFARNGYVCLIIDTLESGEILGNHHGTYRDKMWWWNSRGYTPAGVETWNGIRALDYLSTRPEVDTNRFGITGRSGGGAYSWFVTAMDDRIKAAAPVAGITDLENHVVDGAVEGHCDCMFFVNTYRWDYPQLAALAAPRPLLLCNSDSDSIFPLDGVVRLRNKVHHVYELLGASEKFGLVITPGPHKDTQELQVPVMRWFNKHLKGEEPLIENAAVKLFSPQELKVFEKLPGDAINTNIHFTFVEAARTEVPKTRQAWDKQRDAWMEALSKKSFAAGVPSSALMNEVTMLHVQREPGQSQQIILKLKDPGGASLSSADEKKNIQIRRRFMLLGETLDSLRVQQISKIIENVRSTREPHGSIRLEAEGNMAVNALYASLFTQVDELVLTDLPKSHMNGPDYLNVLRILDVPQALAMASERGRVELRGADETDWQFALQTARNCGFEKNLRITR